jgi:hypothetical protein
MRQHVIVRIVALITVCIFTTTSISWGQVGHPLRPGSQRPSVEKHVETRFIASFDDNRLQTVENPNRPNSNDQGNIKSQIQNFQNRTQNTDVATEEGVHVETRFIASFDDASFNDEQKTTDEHRKHREEIEDSRQIEIHNTDTATEAQRRGEENRGRKIGVGAIHESRGTGNNNTINVSAGHDPHLQRADSLFQVISTAKHHTLNAIIGSIPAHCATIDSYHCGDGDDITVLIQDAHCHYEAQLKQSAILKNLVEDHGFEGIYLEGASGTIDTAIFTAYPHKEVKEKVFTHALKKGQITGADYYAIMREGARTWMHGVEDAALYEKNYQAARELIQRQSTVGSNSRHKDSLSLADFQLSADMPTANWQLSTGNIITLKSTLAILKNQVYSRRLKELDELYETYRPQINTANYRPKETEKPLFELLEHLFTYIGRYRLDVGGFSEFEKLKNVGMHNQDRDAINRVSTEDIDPQNLLSDIDNFTAYLKKLIFRDDKERALDSAWRFACLVEKGTRMELTRREWDELKDTLHNTHTATETQRRGDPLQDVIPLCKVVSTFI